MKRAKGEEKLDAFHYENRIESMFSYEFVMQGARKSPKTRYYNTLSSST